MTLRSPQVAAGRQIARRFTCDGEDISPELHFGGVPSSARSLALVVEDPDAPGGTFTHWLVWGLSPQSASLASGVPPTADQWNGIALQQGRNDFRRPGYGGPCPPHGAEHRYVFRLLALDADPALGDGARRTDFDRAVAAHVVAEAELTAVYRRP
jgi:Raf kinase inhibitor-like YbhB/YbcL family protein